MNATQNALVEQFVPLAHRLAYDAYNASPYKFSARGFDDDDLVGEALEGLVKAARAFDPSKGVPFSSFAFRCIKNKISHASYQKAGDRGCSYLSANEGALVVGSEILCSDFEEQCISAVEVEMFVSGLNKEEAYLLSLLLQGRKQEECAEAMSERFHKQYYQVAVSRMLKKLRLKFSEFFVDGDDARER